MARIQEPSSYLPMPTLLDGGFAWWNWKEIIFAVKIPNAEYLPAEKLPADIAVATAGIWKGWTKEFLVHTSTPELIDLKLIKHLFLSLYIRKNSKSYFKTENS